MEEKSHKENNNVGDNTDSGLNIDSLRVSGYYYKDYEDNEVETELVALSAAIGDVAHENKFIQKSQADFLAQLQSMEVEGKKLMKRFNNTELFSPVKCEKLDGSWEKKEFVIKVHVKELTLEEIIRENPKHTSKCKYILHFPVDFAEPEGKKKFKYVPEVFVDDGITVAYCPKVQGNDEAEFINLERKGNQFYKIEISVAQYHH